MKIFDGKLNEFLEKMKEWQKSPLGLRSEWRVEVEWDGEDAITIDMCGLPDGSTEADFRRIFKIEEAKKNSKLERIKKIIEEDE